MTHLTSTCPTGGRAGPARTWPHFLCRGGPEELGDPALPPDCPSGVRGRSPRPRAASPGPSPHCSSACHGPGPRSRSPPLAPGPPPQSRSNPAHPGGGTPTPPRRSRARGWGRPGCLGFAQRPRARGRLTGGGGGGVSVPCQRARPRAARRNRPGCGRQSKRPLRLSPDQEGSAAPEPERPRPQAAGRDREIGRAHV